MGSYAAVPHTLVAEGDRVVALGDYGGTYRATGRRFDARYAHAWTLRYGLNSRFIHDTDTALAQAAIAAG